MANMSAADRTARLALVQRFEARESVSIPISEALTILQVPHSKEPSIIAGALQRLEQMGFPITLNQGIRLNSLIRLGRPGRVRQKASWHAASLPGAGQRERSSIRAARARRATKRLPERSPRTILEPGREYRVLSIQPPWAWAIFHAGKDVENRTWGTGYRGPLLIHASSRKFGGESLTEARELIAEASGVDLDQIPMEFPRSQLLGLVDLVDIVDGAPSRWAEEWCEHWLLCRPRLLEVPMLDVDGRLNLWKWKS